MTAFRPSYPPCLSIRVFQIELFIESTRLISFRSAEHDKGYLVISDAGNHVFIESESLLSGPGTELLIIIPPDSQTKVLILYSVVRWDDFLSCAASNATSGLPLKRTDVGTFLDVVGYKSLPDSLS